MHLQPKHNTISPSKTSNVGRGTNHGHTLLTRPEVVPRKKSGNTEPPMRF